MTTTPAWTAEEEAQRDAMTMQRMLHMLQLRGSITVGQIAHWDVAYGRYTWDVYSATTLLRTRPPTFATLPTDILAWYAAGKALNPAHVAQADPSKPGILAVYFQVEEGRWESVLIDGKHRAARAHQLGREYRAYTLTPIESFLTLLEHPYSWEGCFYLSHLYCCPEGYTHGMNKSA